MVLGLASAEEALLAHVEVEALQASVPGTLELQFHTQEVTDILPESKATYFIHWVPITFRYLISIIF